MSHSGHIRQAGITAYCGHRHALSGTVELRSCFEFRNDLQGMAVSPQMEASHTVSSMVEKRVLAEKPESTGHPMMRKG